MVKATKSKINDKTMDVLQKTKKQPQSASKTNSVKTPIEEPRRSRSRSMSRTPARPLPSEKTPKKKQSKSQKKPTKVDSDSDSDFMDRIPDKVAKVKGRPKKGSTKAKKADDTKAKDATKKKSAPKKTAPKRVGKEQPTKPRRRAPTPVKTERSRQTPTRQSKRISNVYNSIPSSVDTLDSPPLSNHFGNNKDVDTESISSTSSTSRRGWFSNCVIV